MERVKKNELFKWDNIPKQKIKLMKILKDSFLDNYINLNLKEEQYNIFDSMVKKTYSKIWYNFKSSYIYSENQLWNITNKLILDTFSSGDYLIYISFKTKNSQFWYFHVSLLEWANIFSTEDLLFTNKQEFLSFIQKEVINNFLSKIDWLEEVKISVWKKETTKSINNVNYSKDRLVA